MSVRIRNILPVFLTCFLCLAVLTGQVACEKQGGRGSSVEAIPAERERSEEEFEAELKQRIRQTEAMLEPYRHNGLVEVTTEPAGAEIYIDDGFVTIPEGGLLLPVGTYTFSACWRAKTKISKKVFVTPALQHIVSYDWSFKQDTSSSGGSRKQNISFNADLTKTEVKLVKPSAQK